MSTAGASAESGGECTYCGARVALSSGEQSETRAPSAAAPATPPQGTVQTLPLRDPLPHKRAKLLQ